MEGMVDRTFDFEIEKDARVGCRQISTEITAIDDTPTSL